MNQTVLKLNLSIPNAKNYCLNLEKYDENGELIDRKNGKLIPFHLFGKGVEVAKKTCRMMALSFIDDVENVRITKEGITGEKNGKILILAIPDNMVELSFLEKAMEKKNMQLQFMKKMKVAKAVKKVIFDDYSDEKVSMKLIHDDKTVTKRILPGKYNVAFSSIMPVVNTFFKNGKDLCEIIDTTEVIKKDDGCYYSIQNCFGDCVEAKVKQNFFEISGIVAIEKHIFGEDVCCIKIREMNDKIRENNGKVLTLCR